MSTGLRITLLLSGLTLAFVSCYAQNEQARLALNNETETSLNTDGNEVFGPVFHKVRTGENISAIIRQFGVSKEDFDKWNFLPDGLKPGMKVVVNFSWVKKNNPVEKKATTEPQATTVITKYHRVEPKETLYHLSVVYHVTVEQLKTWNNLGENTIRVGQKLIVGS